MGRKRLGAPPAPVRRLRDRIEGWRRTREALSPMPTGLWGEAVALARDLGPHRVARGLGVSYESLVRRVAEASVGAGGREVGGQGFVELSGAQLLGVSASVGSVVEVADGEGLRLTIRLGAGEKVDVAGLVEGFCRQCA
jgi:hypothetical protein